MKLSTIYGLIGCVLGLVALACLVMAIVLPLDAQMHLAFGDWLPVVQLACLGLSVLLFYGMNQALEDSHEWRNTWEHPQWLAQRAENERQTSGATFVHKL